MFVLELVLCINTAPGANLNAKKVKLFQKPSNVNQPVKLAENI